MSNISFNQVLTGRTYTVLPFNELTKPLLNDFNPNLVQTMTRNYEGLINSGKAQLSLNILNFPLKVQFALGALQLLPAHLLLAGLSSTVSLQQFLKLPWVNLVLQQFNQVQNNQNLTSNTIANTNNNIATATPTQSNSIQGIQGEQSFVNQVNNELQQSIYTPNSEEQKKLDDINAGRAKDGKPPINFQQVTREIENIMNDPSLDEGKKKDLVGQIRKRLGLGKKDMKKLFTKRLANLHQQAADKLNARLESLKSNAKEMERLYGKNSPEALQASQALENSRSVLEPQKQQWEAKASSYKKMFPSFWSKLGHTIKKIHSVITKVVNMVAPLLKMIPVVGTFVALGVAAMNAMDNILKGDWKALAKGLAMDLATAIPIAGNIAQGVMTVAKTVMKYAKMAYQAYGTIKNFAKGNILGGISGLMSFTGTLPEKVGTVLEKGWNAFGSAYSIAKGNIIGGINGLMSFTGSLPEKVGTVLDKGWNAFGSIYSATKGNFEPLFNTAREYAEQIPAVQKIEESLNNFKSKIFTR